MKIKSYFETSSGKLRWGTTVDDKGRADVYIPSWALCASGAFAGIGALLTFISIANGLFSLILLLAVILLLLGLFLLVYWKNFTIRILDEHSFEYSNILGKKKYYRFSELREVKKGFGSIKLILDNGIIDIDSGAVISEEFKKHIARKM